MKLKSDLRQRVSVNHMPSGVQRARSCEPFSRNNRLEKTNEGKHFVVQTELIKAGPQLKDLPDEDCGRESALDN